MIKSIFPKNQELGSVLQKILNYLFNFTALIFNLSVLDQISTIYGLQKIANRGVFSGYY